MCQSLLFVLGRHLPSLAHQSILVGLLLLYELLLHLRLEGVLLHSKVILLLLLLVLQLTEKLAEVRNFIVGQIGQILPLKFRL